MVQEKKADTATEPAPEAEATAWPACVPSLEEARTLMADAAAVPMQLRNRSEQWFKSLTLGQQAALTTPQAVATALACTWRIAMANAMRRDPAAPADRAALQRLRDEADAALDALAAAGPATREGHAELFEATHLRLQRDAKAVDGWLVQVDAQAAKSQPRPRARRSAASEAIAAAAAEATEQKAIPKQTKPNTTLTIAFVAVIVVAAGFHGWRLLGGKPGRVDGAPPASASFATGPDKVEFVFTDDGKPMSAAQLSELRAAAGRRGKQVRELGPGQYAIEPKAASDGEDAPQPKAASGGTSAVEKADGADKDELAPKADGEEKDAKADSEGADDPEPKADPDGKDEP